MTSELNLYAIVFPQKELHRPSSTTCVYALAAFGFVPSLLLGAPPQQPPHPVLRFTSAVMNPFIDTVRDVDFPSFVASDEYQQTLLCQIVIRKPITTQLTEMAQPSRHCSQLVWFSIASPSHYFSIASSSGSTGYLGLTSLDTCIQFLRKSFFQFIPTSFMTLTHVPLHICNRRDRWLAIGILSPIMSAYAAGSVQSTSYTPPSLTSKGIIG